MSLDRHYTRDVIAGTALGYATARVELGQRRGLILHPFIMPYDGGYGLQITKGL